MTPKLTAEQRAALQESPGPVLVEDEETRKTYYLVDGETIEALRRRKDADAVLEGLEDAAAGRVISLEELDDRVRRKYGDIPEA